jgi:hypothetical protein
MNYQNQYNRNQPEKKMSKEELDKKAMEMLFGKNIKSFNGNIWGWKFSMISLIGLLLIFGFAMIGVLTGNISFDEQIKNAKEAKSVKNTINNTDSAGLK